MHKYIVIESLSDHNLCERDDDNNLNEFRGFTIVPIRTTTCDENTVYYFSGAHESSQTNAHHIKTHVQLLCATFHPPSQSPSSPCAPSFAGRISIKN